MTAPPFLPFFLWLRSVFGVVFVVVVADIIIVISFRGILPCAFRRVA